MGTQQKFGGPWTVEKLNILSDYLAFYTTALKSMPFDLIYIDAFAGTGRIRIGDEDDYEIIDGSAKLALQSKGEFSKYIFIEQKRKFAKELEDLVDQEFPAMKSKVDIIPKTAMRPSWVFAKPSTGKRIERFCFLTHMQLI